MFGAVCSVLLSAAAPVDVLLAAFFFGVTLFDPFSFSSDAVVMVTIFLSVLLSPSSFNFVSFDLPCFKNDSYTSRYMKVSK